MTTRRLARSTAVDVSTDAATWLTLPGITDNAPQITPNKQDASDYSSNGWSASDITMQAWTLTIKYNKLADAGTPDPVQELIRACQGQFADAAELYVRWYDTDGGSEAFQGRAIVELQRSKTGVADIAEITVTFTGNGELTAIDNPFSEDVAPVVTSATPSGAAAGALVSIHGQHFLDSVLSSVKFAAVTVTTYSLVSDSLIVAVMPAGSAGSAAVTVTNATGVSNSLPYTRGA